MTEKRFMLDDAGELIDLNNHKFVDYGEECCNCLNELAEENQRLKNDCSILVQSNQEYRKENEQLKSFKSRVFNLLQDEIREESELLDYYLKEKAPCNADRQQIIIGVLKRLKKELS